MYLADAEVGAGVYKEPVLAGLVRYEEADIMQFGDRCVPCKIANVGVATINARLQIVCTFIDTLCRYTTCIMRSLRRSSLCYWSAVDCDGLATS
jgi:hypothetical protein